MMVKSFLLGFTNSSQSIGIKFWNPLDLISSRDRYSLRRDLAIWTAVKTLHIVHLEYKKIKTQNPIAAAREITQWLRVLTALEDGPGSVPSIHMGIHPVTLVLGESSTTVDLGWYYMHVVCMHTFRHTYIYTKINRWMTSLHTSYTCDLWCHLRLCLLFRYLGVALEEGLVSILPLQSGKCGCLLQLEAGCSHLSLTGISPRPTNWNKYFSFPHPAVQLLFSLYWTSSCFFQLPLLTPPLYGVNVYSS